MAEANTRLLLVVALLTACTSTGQDTNLYFGQATPGDTPVVFAPGVISLDGRFEQFFMYSPDGRKITFGTTNADWSAFYMYYMTFEDGRWTDARPAPYLGNDSTALTAAVSFDGDVAFFTDARPSYPPANIWMSRYDGVAWGEPVKLDFPISSASDEWEVAIVRNGTLYFSSNRPDGRGDLDIYRARPVDGAYPTAENLGPPINTAHGDDLPYIAPDESYLIFASDRPGGLGNRDLYVSFQHDGKWSEPKTLGAPINSEMWDIYPTVSPDGQYLFFTRRDAWDATDDSDIYWVSTDVIERLRREETVIQ